MMHEYPTTHLFVLQHVELPEQSEFELQYCPRIGGYVPCESDVEFATCTSKSDSDSGASAPKLENINDIFIIKEII